MPTNVTAATDSFNCPNFVGELFQVGKKKTPFLNMVGGLTGGKQAGAFSFPISQEWNTDAPAQPAVSETDSLAAPAARTYVRGQADNTCQIFHKAVTVSYAKQSQAGQLSGLNLEGTNPIRDEKSFQIMANLKQISQDVDYTFINGVYQAAADNSTAARSRGMLASIATNVIDNAALPAALEKADIKDVVRLMADSGAPLQNLVAFANSTQIQAISALYENDFMEQDRYVGGVAIKTILTDFAELGIVYTPNMPADQVLIVDMDFVAPVFLAVPGKGYLFYEELAKSGAAEKGQLYGQIGLDHGIESFHGKITELT